jgi:hypothetical protein
MLWCYNEHDTMVFYDDNVSLIKNTIVINSCEFITTPFNDNTRETLYIIANNRPPKMQV